VNVEFVLFTISKTSAAVLLVIVVTLEISIAPVPFCVFTVFIAAALKEVSLNVTA
jgi:hypothetical protein